MKFNWLNYLDFAKHIKDNPDVFESISEAAFRAATSRAYYAVFKYAFNLAREEGFQPVHHGDDHIKIQRYLRESETNNKNRRMAATQLVRLNRIRGQVDYDDEISMRPMDLATMAIGMADKIVNLLNEESAENLHVTESK